MEVIVQLKNVETIALEMGSVLIKLVFVIKDGEAMLVKCLVVLLDVMKMDFVLKEFVTVNLDVLDQTAQHFNVQKIVQIMVLVLKIHVSVIVDGWELTARSVVAQKDVL
jgi:hypothetical protein